MRVLAVAFAGRSRTFLKNARLVPERLVRSFTKLNKVAGRVVTDFVHKRLPLEKRLDGLESVPPSARSGVDGRQVSRLKQKGYACL
jgi:hypothetical protein